MILLFDIGNTNTHLGLADKSRVIRQANVPTASWFKGEAGKLVEKFVGRNKLEGVSMCSVVPRATPRVKRTAKQTWGLDCLELSPRTICGVGIEYPKPKTIGPDRLANAVAVTHHFGAPAVVVDFGTAVTFDVVDVARNYVGGIIAPGLAAMTEYLHEKTALLPRIKIREEKAVIGKNTRQAMLIGAVHGYRGLIRELIAELKRDLKASRLPVVATGGYAELIAAKLPEITAVDQLLTLEGLRLVWNGNKNLKTAGSR
ncbi:type III pantothenate kinase [Pedosphaera parvula]|uniref:Type III pantothenate kinase n=1 Tax=Pedosphaera parvula (strain Ellin514) TaxID=320771 RepID=B9XIV5_PEDPL|nr:type III pantothenate kinase [Pedosphaera parvula]EEF60182.1 putative transcriptional acitvator, Baf family [Pedosphaera parvula Ellin514]